jgi:hypothetical protein
VAREFLERSPDNSLEDIVADDLAERIRIIRSVARTDRLVGHQVQIRSLSLTAESAHNAICSCDATIRLDWLAGSSALPIVGRNRIEGPITLTRSETGWRVADYVRNGIPIRSSFRVYVNQSLSVASYMIAPRLLQLHARGLSVIADLTNASAEEAKLTKGELAIRYYGVRRMIGGRIRGVASVAPAATDAFSVGWNILQKRVPSPLTLAYFVSDGKHTDKLRLSLEGLAEAPPF